MVQNSEKKKEKSHSATSSGVGSVPLTQFPSSLANLAKKEGENKPFFTRNPLVAPSAAGQKIFSVNVHNYFQEMCIIIFSKWAFAKVWRVNCEAEWAGEVSTCVQIKCIFLSLWTEGRWKIQQVNTERTWICRKASFIFFLPSWNYLLALLKKPQNRQNEGKQAQRRKISTAALSRFPGSAKSCRFWVPNPPKKKVPGKFTCPSFNSAHHLEFPACSLTSNSHLALPKAAFVELFHLHSWKFFDPQHLLAWLWSIQAPSVGINPWDKAAKIIFLNWLFLARAPLCTAKRNHLALGLFYFNFNFCSVSKKTNSYL